MLRVTAAFLTGDFNQHSWKALQGQLFRWAYQQWKVFLEMYHSAAEFFPKDDSHHMENVDWTVQQEDLQLTETPDLGQADRDLTPMLGWDPEKSGLALHTAISSASDAPLPKRCVQHKKIDIWWPTSGKPWFDP